MKSQVGLLVALITRLSFICKGLWMAAAAIALFILFPPGAAVVLVIVAFKYGRPTLRPGTTHGTARFASLNDLAALGCFFQESGVFLGKVVGDQSFSLLTRLRAILSFPVKRSDRALQIATAGRPDAKPLYVHTPIDKYPHTAIFGATGSGKSTCFAAQTLLRSGDSNLVCLDPKGELVRNFGRFRERHFGHTVYLIDPFGVAEGSGFEPHCFNPLDVFRDDKRRVVDEARRLSNEIVVRTGQESERFWTDAASVLISAVLSFLMVLSKKGASINHVRDITSDPNMLRQILEMMLQSDECNGMLKRLAGEVSGYEGKMGASILAVANSNLAFLDSIPISEVLGESTFDPDALINGRCSIFLCLPVDRLTEMAALQRVILSTLINRVFAAGEDSERRIHFLMDESATLGPMNSLTNAVMFGRSFGLRMTFLFQSASQVDKCFPDSKRNDFMATVSKVYAGSDDLSTAKELSESCGTHSVWSSTLQTGTNVGDSTNRSLQDISYGVSSGTNESSSHAEQSRSLLTPAEILCLPRHLAIALLPGTPPLLFEKVPYYSTMRSFWLKRTLAFLIDASIVALTVLAATLLMCVAVYHRDDPDVERLIYQLTAFWRLR